MLFFCSQFCSADSICQDRAVLFAFVEIYGIIRSLDKLEFVEWRYRIVKSKIIFAITTKIQAIYLFFIILNFLCIWMFAVGIPYTFPFAILGQVLIFFCPVEVFCFIINLIFAILDIKASCERRQIIVKTILVCIFFVFLCLIKIVLYHYGSNLAGVV